MGDLTLQQVMLRIAALLLIAAVHGFATAASAVALGDPGPRHDDRLTLNPLRHLDVIGGLLAVLFTAGWIRPIAVDPARLRAGPAGLPIVVAASSCATIVLIMIFRLVRPVVLNLLPDTASATFFIFVETLGQLGVMFALFNVLPLPMLTGQHLLVALCPRHRDAFRRSQPFAAGALALLILTGIVSRLLGPTAAVISGIVLGS